MQTRLRALLVTATLAMLSACAREPGAREIDWAKAALARNPAFEIVATDEGAGVFTVRDKTTGQVQTIRLQELIASPAPAAKPAQVAAATPAPAESTAVTDDAPDKGEPGQTTTDVAKTPVENASDGKAVIEGPGYRIARGEAVTPQAAPATLEGPGYSIERQRSASPPVSSEAKTAAEQHTSQTVAANVERRTDPIICQGDRLMRIDGETIAFSGDAVIAEKGCDLYISNSNLSAGGVGIIARQARVHIVNSSIGGSRASYEASEGAEIYVARSTITGVGRRFDSATMNDLGENLYPAN
jgi:uncharacterized Zn-binding protein involved in type VI secretion